jgi:penicillin-binding protein 2
MPKKTKFSRTDVRGHTDAIEEQGRAARGGGFGGRSRHIFHNRVIVLLGVFCFIVILYTVNLIALQAAGNAYSVFDPVTTPVAAYTKTVTLQAPRGEIYDRSGNKLVTNSTTYTVSLDYTSFFALGGVEQRNRALLDLLSTLSTPAEGELQPCLSEEFFPFEGEYPNLRLSAAANDPSSRVYSELKKTLSFLGTPDISSQKIVQYYVSIYQLDARVDGIPVYSNAEILFLLRLYYNMDRCAFSSQHTYILAENISVPVMNAMQQKHVPGLRFSAVQQRYYLYPSYATHLLGELTQSVAENDTFCNALGYPVNEIKGKSGCESSFDHLLQGTDGQMTVTYDAYGTAISREIIKEPIAGLDVYLTIDISLQKTAEDALRVNVSTVANTGKAMAGADCNAGAVVAVDPATGEVLAIASYPSYNDIIQTESDEISPFLNRATSALYQPGELFHLCTALCGLDAVEIDYDTVFSDNGDFGKGILCPLYEKYNVSHQVLNVSTALTDGCNVFFATLGQRLSIQDLEKQAAALGFGQLCGIEIGEAAGVVAGPSYRTQAGLSSWSSDMLPMAAVGLSDHRVTPLQLCSALSTILQEGKRYASHVFQDARSYVSGTILEQSREQLLSSTYLNTGDVSLILDSMQLAARANTLLMSKTVSLQQRNIDVGCLGSSTMAGTRSSENALLLSYASENLPTGGQKQIVVCVALEHGANPTLASPTAAAVLEKYYAK